MDLKLNSLNKKHLIVFDFDNTILNGNSGISPVKKFLTTSEILEFKTRLKNNHNFVEIFRDIFKSFKSKGIKLDELKQAIENIPITEGFIALFHYLRENKHLYEVILITGTISIFVNWILEKNKLTDVFSEIYCQKSNFSEDSLIDITQIHSHDCSLCNSSQCKGLILKDFIEKNDKEIERKVYIGDGENDLCPAFLLENDDILFPRHAWGLHKRIEKENLEERLKCRIVYWNSGEIIKEEIYKITRLYMQTKF